MIPSKTLVLLIIFDRGLTVSSLNRSGEFVEPGHHYESQGLGTVSRLFCRVVHGEAYHKRMARRVSR